MGALSFVHFRVEMTKKKRDSREGENLSGERASERIADPHCSALKRSLIVIRGFSAELSAPRAGTIWRILRSARAPLTPAASRKLQSRLCAAARDKRIFYFPLPSARSLYLSLIALEILFFRILLRAPLFLFGSLRAPFLRLFSQTFFQEPCRFFARPLQNIHCSLNFFN